MNSQRWLTPSAPAISRSCVAARTRMPQRVFVEQQVERSEYQRPEHDQQQVVLRERRARRCSTAPAKPGARGPSRSSGPQAQSAKSRDDQHQREGGEQLQQLGRLVDPAAGGRSPTTTPTQRRPRRRRERYARARIRAVGEPARRRYMPSMYSEPCAKLTMRRDAEDQRQPGGDEEQRERARRARSGTAAGLTARLTAASYSLRSARTSWSEGR